MTGLRCATDSAFPVSAECAAPAAGAFTIVNGMKESANQRIIMRTPLLEWTRITEQRRLSRQKSMRLRRGRMWFDESLGQRVSGLRAQEAIATSVRARS
jgi:hypothetical protein